uniref:Uncharacterized protein n=1 Tax=Romanomermis culicivorax TaxID=13658 RepID=A0A915JC88_ROMCU
MLYDKLTDATCFPFPSPFLLAAVAHPFPKSLDVQYSYWNLELEGRLFTKLLRSSIETPFLPYSLDFCFPSFFNSSFRSTLSLGADLREENSKSGVFECNTSHAELPTVPRLDGPHQNGHRIGRKGAEETPRNRAGALGARSRAAGDRSNRRL